MKILALAILLLPTVAYADDFDHRYAQWGQVLEVHVQGGRVDYRALQQNGAALADHLRSLQRVIEEEYEKWSDAEKISFWLNAYNAATVQVILDHYPLKKGLSWKAVAFPKNSIWQIPNVWDRPLLNIFGKEISLNHMEHEILRKKFREPRVHFALVCASMGCPDLREEPYVGATLEGQLTDQVSRFLRNGEKFRYDDKKDRLYLSPILKWFRGDFEPTGGVVEFLKRYLPKPVAKSLSQSTKIKWLPYDWSLNARVDE